MKKWKRSFGTSKREQDIKTPKAPQNNKKYWKAKREGRLPQQSKGQK